MEKIYRGSKFTLFLSIVRLVCATAFVFWLTNSWLSYELTLLITGCTAAVLLLFIIFQRRIEVRISEKTLTISTGRRVYAYERECVGFRAETIDGNTLMLDVLSENGTQDFDLSPLGSTQYEQILNDLNIIGDNSQPIKLSAQRRDE